MPASFLPDHTGIAARALSFGGLFVMIGLAWLLSVDRHHVR